MNTDELKTQLQTEKELLEKELGTVAVADPQAQGGFAAKEDNFDNEPNSIDPAEVGAELESLIRNESISSELEVRYKNVQDALERIENNTYGVCETCDKEIESDRLEANPAAPTCKEHMG